MTFYSFVKVDSAWIAYNKPKSPELANEYAGFLMALGLNGHLTKLATLNIHDYLTKVPTHICTQSHTCAETVSAEQRKQTCRFYLNPERCISKHISGLIGTFYPHAQFTQ